ncbi:MAG: c-type cytochrome [Rubrivivax sp.]|nr:c-type cytochrome [Rubrivivax sp.]MDH5338471.1 c-type cytochrome [Rubrivivax sp.]
MSDSPVHDTHQPSDAHDAPESHESPIKTPKQLILIVVAAFVVPIAIIILLVNYVAVGNKTAAGSAGLSEEAVAHRLQRVGQVEIRDASDVAALRSGEQVFNGVCSACHTTGAAGAPKVGDTAAWAPRIATGYEALLHSALKGKGAMSAQGGGDYSDLEVGRAVVYLTKQAGADFPEPAVPAASAPGGAASAAN